VKRALWQLDPALPILSIATMEERLWESVGRERLLLAVAGAFALIAGALAAVGVYGSTAYWVTRRRRELTLRVALGATRGAVLNLVLGRGMRIAVCGVIGGSLLSIAGGRLLTSLLFNTQPDDPLVLLTTVATLMGLVLLACTIPALSATNSDLGTVLRAE
jgi:putative ABC transport system permease protein